MTYNTKTIYPAQEDKGGRKDNHVRPKVVKYYTSA